MFTSLLRICSGTHISTINRLSLCNRKKTLSSFRWFSTTVENKYAEKIQTAVQGQADDRSLSCNVDTKYTVRADKRRGKFYGVPCKYHAAGYCRIHVEEGKCSMSHNDTYMEAVEAQWLDPSSKAARKTLVEVSDRLGLPLPPAARVVSPNSGGPRGVAGRRQRGNLRRPFDPRGSNPLPRRRTQPFTHFVVIDLEGADEIIEMPGLLINAKTLKEEARFHSWVRPVKLFEGKPLNEKSRAVGFAHVLEDFDMWLSVNGMFPEDRIDTDAGNTSIDDVQPSFAMVTCGNWDLKTQIPKQCGLVGQPVPLWCHSWVNIKDVWNKLYTHKVTGMDAMAKKLDIKGRRFHHLGMHDTECIARILVHLVEDGAKFDITGTREVY